VCGVVCEIFVRVVVCLCVLCERERRIHTHTYIERNATRERYVNFLCSSYQQTHVHTHTHNPTNKSHSRQCSCILRPIRLHMSVHKLSL